ncbi:MAG: SDR family oxidoreductase [Lachnospiraceae bacterium]|nr:SDR family oxidoreductase [Lachnospiraceae bacterium]
MTDCEHKYAVITGASSGIGAEFAKQLALHGYNLILVARRKDRLIKIAKYLSKKFYVSCNLLVKDLSKREDCESLFEEIKDYDIEVFINNAGFGVFGAFADTSLDNELDMISVNVSAVHILTKKMVKYFRDKNRGYLLNVASSAGLIPAGPYMSAYYATKAYVVSLTKGVAEELKEENKNVYVGALCPGPVETEFNSVAGVSFGSKGISAKKCVQIAIGAMFKRKKIIVPGRMLKIGAYAAKFVPESLLLKFVSEFQKGKNK